jgi:hypothetical protein
MLQRVVPKIPWNVNLNPAAVGVPEPHNQTLLRLGDKPSVKQNLPPYCITPEQERKGILKQRKKERKIQCILIH